MLVFPHNSKRNVETRIGIRAVDPDHLTTLDNVLNRTYTCAHPHVYQPFDQSRQAAERGVTDVPSIEFPVAYCG
jgi:hypothetical protein